MTQTQLQQQKKENGTENINNSLKDLIINELNPDVDEFIPEKLSGEESSSDQTSS